MFKIQLILLLFAASFNGYAGSVQIIKAQFTQATAGRWQVSVTLKHADSGWDHYADAWRIVDQAGKILGTRTLLHPHENEQPFTRSLTLEIPKDLTQVKVQAHDKVHGWSKQELLVDLSKVKNGQVQIEQ